MQTVGPTDESRSMWHHARINIDETGLNHRHQGDIDLGFSSLVRAKTSTSFADERMPLYFRSCNEENIFRCNTRRNRFSTRVYACFLFVPQLLAVVSVCSFCAGQHNRLLTLSDATQHQYAACVSGILLFLAMKMVCYVNRTVPSAVRLRIRWRSLWNCDRLCFRAIGLWKTILLRYVVALIVF